MGLLKHSRRLDPSLTQANRSSWELENIEGYQLGNLDSPTYKPSTQACILTHSGPLS